MTSILSSKHLYTNININHYVHVNLCVNPTAAITSDGWVKAGAHLLALARTGITYVSPLYRLGRAQPVTLQHETYLTG